MNHQRMTSFKLNDIENNTCEDGLMRDGRKVNAERRWRGCVTGRLRTRDIVKGSCHGSGSSAVCAFVAMGR